MKEISEKMCMGKELKKKVLETMWLGEYMLKGFVSHVVRGRGGGRSFLVTSCFRRK
jgi:hypothetical protein